jgi:SAM-dependent methyltransferase
MADRLRPFVGHKVMEIGAGIGNMTIQLQPRERYLATDRDDLYLDVLKNMAIRRTNLEAARVDAAVAEHFEPFKEQIDTIVCLNVLEHIPQNMEALKNFYNVLEPGGRVIILVPQGQWLYSPLDKELEHVKRYSRKQLEKELTDAGFKIEETFSFNRMGVVGWFLNGVILRRKRMAKYQLKMYNSLVWFFKIIDPILPWHGLSVVSVARKPGEKKA